MSEKRKYGKRKESLPMNYGVELPPQHLDLEELVLGTVILEGGIMDKVISQFNSNHKASKFSIILLGILTLIFFIGLLVGQSRGAFGVAIILGFLITYLLANNK